MDNSLPKLVESGEAGAAASLVGPHTQLKRHAERGSYARPDVFAIIDESLLCHLSFVVDGQAVTLPTAHARVDDQLYVHGAVANRMLRTLRAAGRASATFTLLDGVVLARTAFHHSMNFRSAVVFGPIHEVTDLDEKRLALHALVEHVAKGRMQELLAPTSDELAATQLLRLTIEEASAKRRSGPPLDAEQDLALDVWAGEVPLELCALPPRREARARPEQLISNAAKTRAERHVPDIIERWHGDYLLSNDVSRIQFDYVHQFLSEQSYWAQGVSQARLRTAFASSLCFGLYQRGKQLGFARVVSDRTRFAYLCDVFVDREHRAHGLGRALVTFALSHPAVSEVDRCLLGTRDAHGLYETLGFERDAHGRFMQRVQSR